MREGTVDGSATSCSMIAWPWWVRSAATVGASADPEPNALSPRTRTCPVAAARLVMAIACLTRHAADLAEAALPPRSLVAATTGAAWSVRSAATGGDRPRSLTW